MVSIDFIQHHMDCIVVHWLNDLLSFQRSTQKKKCFNKEEA
jgi:hypothetical protein